MFKNVIVFSLLILIYLNPPVKLNNEHSGLTITVTFPNLVFDVKKLICTGDRVYSLTPFNVDPHHYELTPKDVETLLNSNVIVSTAHTHFETKIKEIIGDKEGVRVLIEIPNLESMKLKVIPGTNRVNLHSVTYDPNNYLVFMNKLYETLVTLNPMEKSCYENNYLNVVREINYLINTSMKVNTRAVADSPLVQYAVEWLGVEIVEFVVKEHELPPEPSSLTVIEELLRNRKVGLAVVTTPTVDQASVWLRDKAVENQIPVIYVPSPLSNGSYIDKLKFILNQISGLEIEKQNLVEKIDAGERAGLDTKFKLTLLLVAAVAIVPTTWFILKKKLG